MAPVLAGRHSTTTGALRQAIDSSPWAQHATDAQAQAAVTATVPRPPPTPTPRTYSGTHGRPHTRPSSLAAASTLQRWPCSSRLHAFSAVSTVRLEQCWLMGWGAGLPPTVGTPRTPPTCRPLRSCRACRPSRYCSSRSPGARGIMLSATRPPPPPDLSGAQERGAWAGVGQGIGDGAAPVQPPACSAALPACRGQGTPQAVGACTPARSSPTPPHPTRCHRQGSGLPCPPPHPLPLPPAIPPSPSPTRCCARPLPLIRPLPPPPSPGPARTPRRMQPVARL